MVVSEDSLPEPLANLHHRIREKVSTLVMLFCVTIMAMRTGAAIPDNIPSGGHFSIESVVSEQPPEHGGSGADLVHMRNSIRRALELLKVANRELGQSHIVARSSIIRAASILKAGLNRCGNGTSSARRVGALRPWQSRQVRDYIDAHLDKTITVGDLSGVVHLTRAHFSRVFKQTFGLPPHAYVLNRRVERTCELMMEGKSPLSEIALKCGFSDQAHFSRQFRLHTGVTPTAWRRAHL